jgi:hypothetical protein
MISGQCRVSPPACVWMSEAAKRTADLPTPSNLIDYPGDDNEHFH